MACREDLTSANTGQSGFDCCICSRGIEDPVLWLLCFVSTSSCGFPDLQRCRDRLDQACDMWVQCSTACASCYVEQPATLSNKAGGASGRSQWTSLGMCGRCCNCNGCGPDCTPASRRQHCAKGWFASAYCSQANGSLCAMNPVMVHCFQQIVVALLHACWVLHVGRVPGLPVLLGCLSS